jgi:hypothetical protein
MLSLFFFILSFPFLFFFEGLYLASLEICVEFYEPCVSFGCGYYGQVVVPSATWGGRAIR